MGRSRGGLTTKIHALVDAEGLPIDLRLSEGQHADCRYRNLVERFINRIKQARGITTRYDKRADNYLAAIKLFSVRIWLKRYESTA